MHVHLAPVGADLVGPGGVLDLLGHSASQGTGPYAAEHRLGGPRSGRRDASMEVAADTLQKALRINLDPRWYGTIAEIGAGQEVARWFFRAGGAAGTVAKSISAYDMAVSDAVYGKSERYVSMGRLQAMLDHEFQLNLERLDEERGRRQRVLRVRRHRGGPQLSRRQRVPRLDGREVPVPPARRAEPDRAARADARRRGSRCSRRRSASSASTCCTARSSSTTSRRCWSRACSTS